MRVRGFGHVQSQQDARKAAKLSCIKRACERLSR